MTEVGTLQRLTIGSASSHRVPLTATVRCIMEQRHDFSLHSGERQTATDYTAIRADHRYRYEWADRRIPKGGFGADIFCGNGYGTSLLAKTRSVLAIDGSTEAVQQANAHYQTSRNFFSTAHYPFELPKSVFDFVVSLESIEHVEDGTGFFRQLTDSLKPGGLLVFSTPCEDLLPLQSTGNHFHFRHYRLEETLRMASSCPLELVEWAGQDTYQLIDGRIGSILSDHVMDLKPQQAGQFVIVLCRKTVPRRTFRWFRYR